MRVGVLGTGDVGRVLAGGFIELGHEVRMGSRDAANQRATAWAHEAGPRASRGTFSEAAAFADLAVLATLWTGTEAALQAAGAGNLAGKVVIDCTNPLSFDGGGPALAIGTTDSGGEQVQRWLPEARVVKAFNSVGNAHMVHPDFPGGPPDMFICGNDPPAKEQVRNLLTDFGWDTVDLGGIEASRHLEPLCMIWVLQGMRSGSWNHAFKLLRR
ncbi:MAG: NAD(P)-binding domain-containing protein [Candidatus Dormibacteria bacterium]